MHSSPPDVPPTSNHRLWSVLCHLSGFISVPFILPFVVYLAMRHESVYIATNSREALNFHISVFIYLLCCVPFMLVGVGFLMMVAIGLVSLILSIVAAVRSSNGEFYEYPLCLRLVR